jgi:hypothetical protein
LPRFDCPNDWANFHKVGASTRDDVDEHVFVNSLA